MENGVNPWAIQKAMGHSSLETTMGYLHAESLSVNSPLETVLGGKLQRPIQNLSTANEK
jgi:integrase